MSSFIAVRLRCENGHEELNTFEAFEPTGLGNVARICARCGRVLSEVGRALVPDRNSEPTHSHRHFDEEIPCLLPDTYEAHYGPNHWAYYQAAYPEGGPF